MSQPVREKYPLDAEEESTLVSNLALSQVLMLAGGCIVIAVIVGATTNNWSDAFVGGGWARAIAIALATMPLTDTAIAGCLLAVVLFALAWAAQWRAAQTDEGRASILEARRGVNGEFPRMKTFAIVLLMIAAGCAEELLFRYALINGLLAFLNAFMPMPALIAGFVALVVSSFVFWLAHVRYRDFMSTVLTLILAFVLGLAYIVTGSLAVVIIAHALYDIAEVLYERSLMLKEEDYFGGPAPKRVLLEQIEELEREYPDDFDL